MVRQKNTEEISTKLHQALPRFSLPKFLNITHKAMYDPSLHTSLFALIFCHQLPPSISSSYAPPNSGPFPGPVADSRMLSLCLLLCSLIPTDPLHLSLNGALPKRLPLKSPPLIFLVCLLSPYCIPLHHPTFSLMAFITRQGVGLSHIYCLLLT